MKKYKKSKYAFLKWAIPLSVLVLAFIISLIVDLSVNAKADKIDIETAQKIVDDTVASLPETVSQVSKQLVQDTSVKVNSMKYGMSKNVILSCSYTTKDIYSLIKDNANDLMSKVYAFYLDNENAGKKTNATKVMLYISEEILSLAENCKALSGDVEIELYQSTDGYTVYLNDETVNTILGGILDAQDIIKNINEVEYKGEKISIVSNNTLRNGCYDCIKLSNYSNEKPASSSFYIGLWEQFVASCKLNFGEGKWHYLTRGLLTTLEITFISLLIGLVIGFVAAIIRTTHDKTGTLGLLNKIFEIYIAVIRGTPVMIQLLIIYFVVLLPIGINKFTSAVICFGINSGSYVAEIVRGGLMSVDPGQDEAGRSLGFNYVQTMIYIVIPQAFKAVLPSLANEFISLLKETSVAFYIGVADLTQGGIKIRSITYSNFMPLVAVAVIYFVLVYILTKLVSLLEKRLRKSER